MGSYRPERDRCPVLSVLEQHEGYTGSRVRNGAEACRKIRDALACCESSFSHAAPDFRTHARTPSFPELTSRLIASYAITSTSCPGWLVYGSIGLDTPTAWNNTVGSEANCSVCSRQFSVVQPGHLGHCCQLLAAQAPDPDFSGYVQVLFADPRR